MKLGDHVWRVNGQDVRASSLQDVRCLSCTLAVLLLVETSGYR